jgi:hypothetical protein
MWFGENQMKPWPLSSEEMAKIKGKKMTPKQKIENPKLAKIAERWKSKLSESWSPGQMGPIANTVCQEAASGKSTCRVCKSFIAHKELRIGVPHPDYDNSYKWHHVSCAIEKKLVWSRLVFSCGGSTSGWITSEYYRYKEGDTVMFKNEMYTFANGKMYKITDASEKPEWKEIKPNAERFFVPIRNGETRIEELPSGCRVFYINVGNIPSDEVHQYLVKVKDNLTKKPPAMSLDPLKVVNLKMSKVDDEDLNGLPSVKDGTNELAYDSAAGTMTPRDWDNIAKTRKSLEEQLSDIDKKYDAEVSRIKRNAWSRRKAKKEPQIDKKVGSAVSFMRLLTITVSTSAIMAAIVAAVAHTV